MDSSWKRADWNPEWIFSDHISTNACTITAAETIVFKFPLGEQVRRGQILAVIRRGNFFYREARGRFELSGRAKRA